MKVIVFALVFMALAPEWVACASAESQVSQAPECAGVDKASCEEKSSVQSNEEASLLQVNIGADSQANAPKGKLGALLAQKTIMPKQKSSRFQPISPDVFDQICASRSDYKYAASLAELAERFDDMAEAMSKVVTMSKEEVLLAEEQQMFSRAFDKSVEKRQKAIVQVQSCAHDEATPAKVQVAESYAQKLQSELISLCTTAIDLLENILIPGERNAAAKNSGDRDALTTLSLQRARHYALMTKNSEGKRREELQQKTGAAYKETYTLVEQHLAPTHLLRLQVALEYSEFEHDFGKPAEGQQIAYQAWDSGIAELDYLDGASQEESLKILQSIRDNLASWE